MIVANEHIENKQNGLMSHLMQQREVGETQHERERVRLTDGSSIAIPCVFSAETTGAGFGAVVDDVGGGGGEVVLGVVGRENISSSCNENDDMVFFCCQALRSRSSGETMTRNKNKHDNCTRQI